jgi:hypothetical protein
VLSVVVDIEGFKKKNEGKIGEDRFAIERKVGEAK